MTWTRFMDMHSGGSCKEKPFEYIYIEAPESEAEVIFYNRFGHNPGRVSCTCCGSDYSVQDHDSLEQASAYDRNCEWSKEKGEYVEEERERFPGSGYKTLEEYADSPDVLIIPASEIKPEERTGEIPEQGYVWV